MNEDRQHDEVMDRRLDWALGEVVGDERAPDVTAAVLRRAARDEVVEFEIVRSPRSRRLLTAAVALIGLGAVVGAFLFEREPSGGAAQVVAPAQGPDEPEWTKVTDPAAIEGLAPDVAAVEVRNFDDAALAALVARCPRLQALRVSTSAAFRVADDAASPTSITDAALADIARLTELRRLELVGTTEVEGAELQRLDALPLLETLVLSWFDLPGEALQALARFPSLRVLDVRFNHTVGKAGCEAIARCAALRELHVTTTFLTPAEIAVLGRLTGLVELSLQGGFRDIRRPGIGPRARLESQLGAAKNAGAGLRIAGLPGWPRLRVLDLRRNRDLEPEVGEVLRTKCPELREARLGNCRKINDVTVAELVGLRWLHTLDLSECPNVSEHCVPLLRAARQVRDLRVDGQRWMTLAIAEQLILSGKRPICRLTPGTEAGDGMSAEDFNAGMKQLAQRYEHLLSQPMAHLVQRVEDLEDLPDDARSVRVERGVSMDESAFARLAELSGLERLSLSQVDDVSRDGLEHLTRLPKLQALEFTRINKGQRDPAVIRSLLAPLPRIPALQELTVVGAADLGAANRAAILACKGLRHLVLDSCRAMPSAWLASLGQLRDLEVLRLVNVQNVNDEVVRGLQPLTELRELVLWRADVGAAALQSLAGMQQLRSLTLCENTRLDEAALQQIPVTITELGLIGCPKLDVGAARLLRDRFPTLESIYLSENAWLTDDALALVLQLPRLRALDVRGCNALTADSAAAIGDVATLRSLNVWDCDWLTLDLVEALRARRPELDIAHDTR